MAEVRVDIENGADLAVGDVVAIKGQPYVPLTVTIPGDKFVKVMWFDLKRRLHHGELLVKSLHKVTAHA
ncbi:hypothetical protein HU675_0038415 [Bradyrhizobium septentrionale]|uniref:hypothetical protein n=1 Tax=Bradyrhizobium septentrionale TaxID=1404411 RepID=UPI001596A88D|nr:hypothetical protein [Bradyrhizobium septentrionale]UGY23762.1 hypothetical protein HU675_0038415 [Bradyrhizobium septentrionale]